jgi:uncharacterized protein YegL
MAGEPIAALNRGLHIFRDELLAVPPARKRVEVAVVASRDQQGEPRGGLLDAAHRRLPHD